MAEAVKLETPVVVDGCCLPLGQFFADNADGIEPEEQAQIVLTLARGETYRGGGGAAGEWSVALAPHYVREFPDFADVDMPAALFDGTWADESWHNDVCPSFQRGSVLVYVEHPDPAQRECGPEAPRFSIRKLDAEGCVLDAPLEDAETWEAALDAIARIEAQPEGGR